MDQVTSASWVREKLFSALSGGGYSPPPSGKIEQFVGERQTWVNFKYSCFLSQTGKRENELSTLNMNNKSGEEVLQENWGE